MGMITFLALAHTVDATQLQGLGWGGVGMALPFLPMIQVF